MQCLAKSTMANFAQVRYILSRQDARNTRRSFAFVYHVFKKCYGDASCDLFRQWIHGKMAVAVAPHYTSQQYCCSGLFAQPLQASSGNLR